MQQQYNPPPPYYSRTGYEQNPLTPNPPFGYAVRFVPLFSSVVVVAYLMLITAFYCTTFVFLETGTQEITDFRDVLLAWNAALVITPVLIMFCLCQKSVAKEWGILLGGFVGLTLVISIMTFVTLAYDRFGNSNIPGSVGNSWCNDPLICCAYYGQVASCVGKGPCLMVNVTEDDIPLVNDSSGGILSAIGPDQLSSQYQCNLGLGLLGFIIPLEAIIMFVFIEIIKQVDSGTVVFATNWSPGTNYVYPTGDSGEPDVDSDGRPIVEGESEEEDDDDNTVSPLVGPTDGDSIPNTFRKEPRKMGNDDNDGSSEKANIAGKMTHWSTIQEREQDNVDVSVGGVWKDLIDFGRNIFVLPTQNTPNYVSPTYRYNRGSASSDGGDSYFTRTQMSPGPHWDQQHQNMPVGAPNLTNRRHHVTQSPPIVYAQGPGDYPTSPPFYQTQYAPQYHQSPPPQQYQQYQQQSHHQQQQSHPQQSHPQQYQQRPPNSGYNSPRGDYGHWNSLIGGGMSPNSGNSEDGGYFSTAQPTSLWGTRGAFNRR